MDESEYIQGDKFEYHPPEDELVPGSPLDRFKTLIEQADHNEIDLAEAALIIASEEYPGLKESAYLDELDKYADDISVLISGESDPWRIIGFINEYLFNQKGYRGNQTDYNDPRNSYLNEVLDRRTGLPITLSLVYLEIARRLNVPIEGIGLPGHFIVRYHKPGSAESQSLSESNSSRQFPSSLQSGLTKLLQSAEDIDGQVDETVDILIDPFSKGEILSEEDCIRRIREVYGRTAPFLATFMRPVKSRQFLMRMLSNLRANYTQQPDFERAMRIQEFMIVLSPGDYSEIRDRGAIHFRLGHFWAAIRDMRSYLQHVPNAPDAAQINQHIRNIYQEMVVRN